MTAGVEKAGGVNVDSEHGEFIRWDIEAAVKRLW